MAVKATHFNPFRPQQLLQHRDLMNTPIQGNAGCAYTPQRLQFIENNFGAALQENQPFYPPAAVYVGLQAKTAVKTDNVLAVNVPVPRKRSRDQLYASPNFSPLQKNNTVSPSPLQSFACEDDILPQIQQHQLEIDAIVSQHMKKIKLELEERQKQQAKLLAAAIGEGVVKMLKEKDDQIQRMAKLNLILQERVKSLYVENQLLRELAQTNEATANSLRSNLEQVLMRFAGEENAAAEEEVASCCGSSDNSDSDSTSRQCRKCGEGESSVLLLPCRHLCLCNGCGSGPQQIQACPVCHSSTNATLHVNFSA